MLNIPPRNDQNKKEMPLTEEQKRQKLARRMLIERDQFYSNYNPHYQRTPRHIVLGGNCGNLRGKGR